MLYVESVPVRSGSVSYGHITEFSLGLDFAQLRVGQWLRLVTEPPPHRRLSACVGAHYAPGLLRMSLGCVTRGCHGDASE